jgi:(1->4)-alpha-D-glucan 1-alpha-D-glucosylmutase
LKKRFTCAPADHIEHARLLVDHMEDGAIKLYVTRQGLHLRRRHATLFAHGEYVPLEGRGEHADRVCVFARTQGSQAVVVVAPRLIGQLVAAAGAPLGATAWADTAIVLPDRLTGHYCNIYTRERVASDSAGALPLSSVLSAFPVALLSRVSENPLMTAD